VTGLGVLLLIMPHDTVRAMARLGGVALLVLGAVDLVAPVVRGALASIRSIIVIRGILTVSVGVALLATTDATVKVLAILLGMQLVVGGGVSLLVAVRLRRRFSGWQGVAARGLIQLAVGFVVLLVPGLSVEALAVLFGVQWVVGGVVSTAAAVAVASRPLVA
jgi:uncharacterized membrane protein HdeD (DUF308 family)